MTDDQNVIKWIRTIRHAKCASCHTHIQPGNVVLWSKDDSSVWCRPCGERSVPYVEPVIRPSIPPPTLTSTNGSLLTPTTTTIVKDLTPITTLRSASPYDQRQAEISAAHAENMAANQALCFQITALVAVLTDISHEMVNLRSQIHLLREAKP